VGTARFPDSCAEPAAPSRSFDPSAAGTVTVAINLSLAATGLKGVRIVAAAVVADPQMSSPIATIAGPTGLTVR